MNLGICAKFSVNAPILMYYTYIGARLLGLKGLRRRCIGGHGRIRRPWRGIRGRLGSIRRLRRRVGLRCILPGLRLCVGLVVPAAGGEHVNVLLWQSLVAPHVGGRTLTAILISILITFFFHCATLMLLLVTRRGSRNCKTVDSRLRG